MCALVANDSAKQDWLRSAGLLQVLHRLTLVAQPQHRDDVSSSEGDVSVGSALGQHLSLSVQRQCARILAILSQQQDALVGVLFPIQSRSSRTPWCVRSSRSSLAAAGRPGACALPSSATRHLAL